MKKLMSSIMVMALAFSSAFIAQPVKADTTPTVEVVGATLRLNNESDVQAMRFAIKVTNADKAKDCGITIGTKNGKQKVISVENNYKKIYDKDGNTITYTAVVTGIPASYAAEDFQFSGSVTPIVGDKTTTDTVSRNLTQVANAAGLAIDTTSGEIVATDMGGDLVNKENWNEGKISLDKNLGGKTVNFSFKMRVQGAIADGVKMNFQTNYGGPQNQENPNLWNNTINNTWTTFNFQWNMPQCGDQFPALYLSKSDGSSYDANTMKFYVKDFSVSVDDPNANDPNDPNDPNAIQIDLNSQLLFLIKSNPSISRKELSDRLNISDRRAREILKDLQESGVLKRQGTTRGIWIILK